MSDTQINYRTWETESREKLFDLLYGDYYQGTTEDKIRQLNETHKSVATDLVRTLGINRSKTLLEIGSGLGYTAKYLAPKSREIHCLDISSSFLEYAKKECEDCPNVFFQKIEKIPTDLDFLPENMFDIAYSLSVFIHLNLFDIYWYLKGFSRILKKGGIALLTIGLTQQFDHFKDKFIQMAEIYKKNCDELPTMLCWNDLEAVKKIAELHNLKLIKNIEKPESATNVLIFRK